MNKSDLITAVKQMGLSDKAARVYLASLLLGETTVLELAKESGVSRTSIYYTLDELRDKGMIIEVERGKKIYIMYVEPECLVKEARQRALTIDEFLPALEEIKFNKKRKPRIEFYFGPAGFKEVWFKVFHSGLKEFRIITDASHFNGYVKPAYILDEIIAEKRKLGIKSRQIIVDSPDARKIIMKDEQENRKSKLISKDYPFAFTEIITNTFVVYISPRQDNVIFTIDQEGYADTKKHVFDALWETL
jgi:sugar-specific transcriptional regulator TrmB